MAPSKAAGASRPHSEAAEPQQTLNLPQTLLSGSATKSDRAEENRFVYLHCMCLLCVFQETSNKKSKKPQRLLVLAVHVGL